ncbi:uncharacterized protein LOC129595618 [Paramacrobiotus metropolitanus]|uniref:uncharacterized protein LOC129595618 n=1 Tax=Paramacrobiotus metropolitanus TaxID=2943436 RepID=UPI002445ABB2|nr:uncharacterized protein LOC129595618 [Paramacrobiotus metropolitanus]
MPIHSREYVAKVLLILDIGIWLQPNVTIAVSGSCPVECRCENRDIYVRLLNHTQTSSTTSCSSRNLKRIPRDLSSDTEAILLRNNSITMHVGIKNAGKIRLLDLSHNMIQGFFGRLSLPHLQHLDLGYNLIPRVSSGDNDFFQLLRNLQTLSLRGNAIRTVDSDTLDLPRLRVLDLAENSLTSLKVGVFTSLSQLTHLDVGHNNLSDLWLNFLTLSHLDISFNRITSLKCEHLNATTLDISGNAFVILDAGSLQGIETKHLNLSFMPYLWKIASSALSGISGVNTLDLSHNYNLTFIEDGFVGMNNVSVMNVDRSSIVQVPLDISAASDMTASLIGVPLSCPINIDYLVHSQPHNATCVWQGQILTVPELTSQKNMYDWSIASPQIIPTFPKIITMDLGMVLEIQCTAFPSTARINWFRLDERRKIEQPMPSISGMLQLRPLNFVNSGKYLCRATSEYGAVNRTVQVIVTYAPVVIIPLMITHQYVTFAWNNSDPSIASQFRVRYFEWIGENFTLIRTVFMDHLVRRYTIGNLKAGTLYKFCLYLNKSGTVEELDCKNMTKKMLDISGRPFGSAYELLIVIGCISQISRTGRLNWMRYHWAVYPNYGQIAVPVPLMLEAHAAQHPVSVLWERTHVCCSTSLIKNHNTTDFGFCALAQASSGDHFWFLDRWNRKPWM